MIWSGIRRVLFCDDALVHISTVAVKGVHELEGRIHHFLARVILKNISTVDSAQAPQLWHIIASAIIANPIVVLLAITGSFDIQIYD